MNTLWRSTLYVPGSNQRALLKAASLPCDAVILDLEDAVAADAKDAAREQVVGLVHSQALKPRGVVVRINDADSPWHIHDAEAVVKAKPDAILLPKVRSLEHLQALNALLNDADPDRDVALWAMIETPEAVLNVSALSAYAAETGSRLHGLVLGLNDLALETGLRISDKRQALWPVLSSCVMAARAYRLTVLDGVNNALNDAARFAAECRQARDFGFDGKTIVHPDQIAAANEAFSPCAEDLAWAQDVRRAWADPANKDRGAIRVGNVMTERLHLKQAERLLSTDQAISERNQRLSFRVSPGL